MSDSVNMNEFLEKSAEQPVPAPEPEAPAELDVQKVVVEELAADKATLESQIANLNAQIVTLQAQLVLDRDVIARQQTALAAEKAKVQELEMREPAVQDCNSNAVALLDRDPDLPDRFQGETRDHVLDALREARDRAEAEGRLRRAQLLESVLMANEPSGNLRKKRAALEKFLNENGNILSGPVINELDKYGIKYKDGDKYLLITEILTRTY